MTDSLTGAGVRYRWMQHFLTEQLRIASEPSIRTVCEVGFNAGHSALRWLLRTKAKAHIIHAVHAEGMGTPWYTTFQHEGQGRSRKDELDN